MPSITVELRNIAGTGAVLGWAGSHTVVVDRPDGRAGGTGLGFNGGELLALAIGGCFCNDLRYAAERMDVGLGQVAVDVVLDLAGEPPLATGATLTVSCATLDGGDAAPVIERATRDSTVANSLIRGVAVTVVEAS